MYVHLFTQCSDSLMVFYAQLIIAAIYRQISPSLMEFEFISENQTTDKCMAV